MKKSVAKGCLSILLSLALVIGMIPSFDVKADPAEGGNGEQPKVYYGDVDDDGEIGPKDVTMLRRFLAGGWNVSINEEKADVDGDGEVGPKDVTVLRRYLAGGWGIKLPDAPDDVLEYPVAIDAQHFPDEAFRRFILSDIDHDKDNYLSKEEADSSLGLYLGGAIKDVTGIEYFGNIETLECLWQGLEKLDVSKNKKLKKINCAGNRLTSLDVSQNTELTELYCYNNLLTELDVSSNTALTLLSCGRNQIEELNLSANDDLKELYCWDNKLTNLNLSNNKELQDLSCGENLIESLDISQNTKLIYLYCWKNKLSELSLENNTLIEVISCDENQLPGLVLDANTKLIFLDCSKNYLTRLDLSNNTRLTDLKHDQNVEVIRCVEISKDVFPDDIFRSYVSGFDTDNNGSFSVAELETVKDIDVSGTNVVTLTGIEAFGHLDSLNCSNTKIEQLYFGFDDETFLTIGSIDASNNPEMTGLSCWEMGVESLKVSGEKINYIECEGNRITELDLSGCPALERLYCSENNIQILDLSNNTKIKEGYVSYDPTTQVIWEKELPIEVSYPVQINESAFPDEEFMSYVSQNYDLDDDGYLSQAEAEAVTSLSLYETDIVNLRGIEYFSKLEILNCIDGGLKKVNLSANTELKELCCDSNNLVSLDLSNNTNLKKLSCGDNCINSLNLSNNVELAYLYCVDNDLEELNLSSNIALEELNCSYNFLEELDLSNNIYLNPDNVISDLSDNQIIWSEGIDLSEWTTWPIIIDEEHFPDEAFREYVNEQYGTDGVLTKLRALNITYLNVENKAIQDLTGIEYFKELITINCENNQIENLYLGGNTNLKNLYCENNKLSTLDVSACPSLKSLWCSYNNFSELDLSNNTSLTYLNCYSDLIDVLDLSNCPEMNVSSVGASYGVTVITCDNPQGVGIDIDDSHFPDPVFRSRILEMYDRNGDAKLSDAEIEAVTYMNLPNNQPLTATTNIRDLTGIEYFTSVEDIVLYQNELVSVNFSNNKKLKTINIDHTYTIESIIVSECTELKELYCGDGKLESLDVSNNTKLQKLYCGGNALTALNLSNNESLIKLICSSNKLELLDVDNCLSLEYLSCGSNLFTSLNLSNNTALTVLDCQHSKLTTLDLSHNTELLPENVSVFPLTSIIWAEGVDNPSIMQGEMVYHYGNVPDSRVTFESDYYATFSVDYTYDQAGRVTAFTATSVDTDECLQATYEYNNSGVNTKTVWTYSDGIQYEWEYNDADQLVGKTEKAGVPYKVEYGVSGVSFETYGVYDTWHNWGGTIPMVEFTYAYDNEGRITSIICHKLENDEIITVSFEYSGAINVKTSWTYSSGKSLSWAFDESGNCIQRSETLSDGIESYTYDGKGRIIKEINSEVLIYLMPGVSKWRNHAWEWSYILSEKNYEYDDNGKIIKIICKRLDDGRSVTATFTYENGYNTESKWLYSDGSSRSWEAHYDEDGNLLGYTYNDSYGNSEIYQARMYIEDVDSWHTYSRISAVLLDLEHYDDGYIRIPCVGGNLLINSSLNYTGYNIEYEYGNDSCNPTKISISDTGSDAVFVAEYEYENNKLLRYVYNYPDGQKENDELYENGKTKYTEYISADGSIIWYRYDAEGKRTSSYGDISIPSYAYTTGYGWEYEYEIYKDNMEETYTYDEEGKLLKVVCIDEETSDVTVIEYEYSDDFNTKRTITYPSGQIDSFENIKIDENSFPDTTFRTYVLQNIDNWNGVLTKSEVDRVYSITLIDMEIESLKGIEYFTKLQTLRCCSNAISELDLSKNTMLYDLDCSSNNLSALDISKNTELSYLTCSVNNLGALDISNNTKLMYLYCKDNNIISIDITNNPYLSTGNVVCDEGVEIIS